MPAKDVNKVAASEAMLCKTKMCNFFAQGFCSKGQACFFAHGDSDLNSRPNFHKTQLCMAFQRNGICRDGRACKYAHGKEELRTPTGTLQSSVLVMQSGTKQIKDDDIWSVKTSDEECGLDLESFCSSRQISETSEWSHSSEDGLSELAFCVSEDGLSAGDSEVDICDKKWKKDKREARGKRPNEEILIKTKMCKFFMQGKCSKGETCQFAHTCDDLQCRPNLHKTRLCMAFQRTGSCREGTSCKYAHGINELRNFAVPTSNLQATLQLPIEEKSGVKQMQSDFSPTVHVDTTLEISVKNTFLHVSRNKSKAHLRSTSCHW